MRYTKVKTNQDVKDWYKYLVKNGMDGNISDTCYGYDIAFDNYNMKDVESCCDFYQDEDGYFLIDERMYFCCMYGVSDETIDAYTDYIPLKCKSDRYNL